MAGEYRSIAGLLVAVALLPAVAHAQALARSFDEAQRALQVGQAVLVTDDRGRTTKGRVAALTPSSLTVDKRTIPAAAVREIRMADPLWNGALIGAAIGAGLAVWDYTIDPSEPGNAAISAVAVGAGAAIGAGVDALTRGKLLYAAPQRAVAISLLMDAGRRGAVVSVRF